MGTILRFRNKPYMVRSKRDAQLDDDSAQEVFTTVVALLRIVRIEGQHGDLVVKSFDNLHYVPVFTW